MDESEIIEEPFVIIPWHLETFLILAALSTFYLPFPVGRGPHRRVDIAWGEPVPGGVFGVDFNFHSRLTYRIGDGEIGDPWARLHHLTLYAVFWRKRDSWVWVGENATRRKTLSS